MQVWLCIRTGKQRTTGVPPEILLPIPPVQARCLPLQPQELEQWEEKQGCVKYRIVPSDYRLSIDRHCLYFKRTYALRTECERYNSRFKASGQERLWVRNGNSVANLNTLAHISALAVALAAVLSGSHPTVHLNLFRRSALTMILYEFFRSVFLRAWFLWAFFGLPGVFPSLALFRLSYLELVLLNPIYDISKSLQKSLNFL